MKVNSYSQYAQDLHVCAFYEDQKNGYFVDIGAFDGVSLSNTYKLETEHQWTGICIEPQEDQFEKLAAQRSSICVKNVLSDTSGETLQFSKGRGGNSVLSGLTRYLDGWGKGAALRGDQIIVQSSTLTEVLDQHNAPGHIDFMSLDTEGSELEILQGTDLSRYRFGYLCIEHNHVVEKRASIRQLLEQHGYFFYRENECDDDYYHRSTIGGTYFFNQDFNRPIEVELLEDNGIIARSSYWPDEEGVFFPQRLEIQFENMGRRTVTANSIARSSRNRWSKR